MSVEKVDVVSGKSPVTYKGVPFDSPEGCLAYWEIQYESPARPKDWYKFRGAFYANMETAYKCHRDLSPDIRMRAAQSVLERANGAFGRSVLFGQMGRADREKMLTGMNSLFESSLYNNYRGPAYAALGAGGGFAVTYGASFLRNWVQPLKNIKMPVFMGIVLLDTALGAGAAWLYGRPSSQAPDLEVIERLLSKQGNN